MVNAEMRITTSVYHSTKSWQGGSANLINEGDNLRKTKLPDAKQRIKYLVVLTPQSFKDNRRL